MNHPVCFKEVAAALHRHSCSRILALWRGKPASTGPHRAYHQPAGKSEAGVALILAMLVILVLTVLAASIIFVTQSQVWTSFNYKLVTQCRYAAEGGVHQTMDWLQNTYVPPTIPFPPAFDVTKYPVQYNNRPVVLAGDATFNYPDPLATIQPAYKAALYQKPVDPISNLTYSTSATLMAMTPLQGAFPGVPTAAIQIWQVTSVGTYIGAVRNAQVQLVVTYQKMLVSATANALYGTSTACPALVLQGGSVTNSYNSSLPGPPPQGVLPSGGNVGTNGGLLINGGSTTVNGNFSYSPTDPCSPALSPATTGVLNGSQIALPIQPPYPTPPPPNPVPPTTNQSIDGPKGCDTGGLSSAGSGCTNVVVGSDEILAPTNPGPLGPGPAGGPAVYGNLQLAQNGNVIELSAQGPGIPGIYDINSISMNAGVTLKIDSCPVILEVTGTGQTTPVVITGMSYAVANSPPSCFQIVYGGTGTLKLTGGSQSAGVVYAPNASIQLSGGGTWNGALIGNTVAVSGGTVVHYDRALGSAFYIAGPYVPMGFNWSSF